MSLNKVMLIGNVGKDPEVRYLEGNGKVSSFRLATTEKYRDRDGNLREITEWHSIVTWRNMADLVEKYVKKGTQLYVEGRLRTRSWNDRAGNAKSVTEIMADSIQLLGRAPGQQTADGAGNKASGSGNADIKGAGLPGRMQAEDRTGTQPPAIPSAGIVDDDLPF